MQIKELSTSITSEEKLGDDNIDDFTNVANVIQEDVDYKQPSLISFGSRRDSIQANNFVEGEENVEMVRKVSSKQIISSNYSLVI